MKDDGTISVMNNTQDGTVEIKQGAWRNTYLESIGFGFSLSLTQYPCTSIEIMAFHQCSIQVKVSDRWAQTLAFSKRSYTAPRSVLLLMGGR